MVKIGVQPRVIRRKVGKSAYNFALYCGSAPATYTMFRRAIDGGARPAAVVVDFQPELLMGDPMKLLNRVFPELLTARETFQLCRDARDAARFAEFTVASILPSARKRFEVRAAVVAAIRGESASVRDKLLAARRNWKVHNGAEVLPKNPHYRGEVPEAGAYPSMFWVPWRPNELNRLYLEKFLDLAASRKIPVFWTLQPNAAEVDARREKVGYNAQFGAFVRHYLAKYPNLIVVDGRHVNYPHQVFTDPVHLDRHGAVAFSLGLADILRARLVDRTEGPRWVALPDHRGEINSIALEDHDESAIALRAGEGMTRR